LPLLNECQNIIALDFETSAFPLDYPDTLSRPKSKNCSLTAIKREITKRRKNKLMKQLLDKSAAQKYALWCYVKRENANDFGKDCPRQVIEYLKPYIAYNSGKFDFFFLLKSLVCSSKTGF